MRLPVPATGENPASRGLRASAAGLRTVLFAVPDLNEPYFAELTALVVRRAEDYGLSLVIFQTWGDHEREVNAANGVGVPLTDGLLHIPRSLSVSDLTRRASPGPLVLLGEHIVSSPFAHVTIDNHAAAAAATEHLLMRGCIRPAMIGPREPASDASNRRFAGYRSMLQQRGMPFDPALAAGVAAFTPQEGYAATSRLIDDGVHFDGAVCSNDSVAFGVLAALSAHGISVPGDVRVIGMDGVTMGAFSVPSLSTVEPQKELMVSCALSLLNRQMTTAPSRDLPVEQVTVPFSVLERASTA
ncbi:MAG: LacI family DNA-binding transcriptional regulator [Arachnia sp.]